MNHNHPNVAYNSDSFFKKIGNNYSSINNISKGNYGDVAATALAYIPQRFLPLSL
jgi:hypothetical protein